MKLFHASFNEYELEKKLSNQNKRVIKEGLNEIESFFDERRPTDCLSRYFAKFAFDRLEYAAHFIFAEKRQKEILKKPIIYRVSMDVFSKHPMYLIDYVAKTQNKAKREKAIQEYWNPTQKWKVWEYLGADVWIKCKEEFPETHMQGVSIHHLLQDRNLTQQLWT